MAADGGGGGDHDLRQRGSDGDHGGADDQIGDMKTLRNTHGAVHKKVAALDEHHKTNGKQQNGNQHKYTPFPAKKYARPFYLNARRL